MVFAKIQSSLRLRLDRKNSSVLWKSFSERKANSYGPAIIKAPFRTNFTSGFEENRSILHRVLLNLIYSDQKYID